VINLKKDIDKMKCDTCIYKHRNLRRHILMCANNPPKHIPLEQWGKWRKGNLKKNNNTCEGYINLNWVNHYS
jgi:hypothetical protein